jgi:hypothetical protein
MRAYKARTLSRDEATGLYAIVDRLRQRAGLPMPTVAIAPDAQPNALMAGAWGFNTIFSRPPRRQNFEVRKQQIFAHYKQISGLLADFSSGWMASLPAQRKSPTRGCPSAQTERRYITCVPNTADYALCDWSSSSILFRAHGIDKVRDDNHHKCCQYC